MDPEALSRAREHLTTATQQARDAASPRAGLRRKTYALASRETVAQLRTPRNIPAEARGQVASCLQAIRDRLAVAGELRQPGPSGG